MALAAAACAASAQSTQDPQGSTAGPTCRPAELRALFRGFQVAGGSMTGAVVLTNAGSRACRLDGTPRSVSLMDDSGGTVSVKSRPLAVPVGAGPVELVPAVAPPAFGAPPPRGSAWFLVTWSNWCGDDSPTVQSLLVVLPDGGSISAQPAAAPSYGGDRTAPRCDDARAGSTLTIGRLQAPGA